MTHRATLWIFSLAIWALLPACGPGDEAFTVADVRDVPSLSLIHI